MQSNILHYSLVYDGMNPTSWSHDLSRIEYPPYSGITTTDVVIIGGGLVGVLSAYLIAKAGKQVILLEKETLGSGMTMCTTGFITEYLDTDVSDLITIFKKSGTKELLSSHQEAINLIESIVREEHIECEFSRCSHYIYANHPKDLKHLAREAKALMDLGIKIKLREKGEGTGFPNAGYIELTNQAKFHPIKFLLGVARRAQEYGALIYEHSEAEKRTKGEGGLQNISTRSGSIEAQWAIIATYKPFNDPLSLYFKKASYISYVFEMELRNQKLEEGTYEDLENPYHYFRVDGNMVMIGGEDHRQDIPVSHAKNFQALRRYADSIISPRFRTITKQWSGIILEPVDGKALIGRINEEQVLYALGFSGNGMSYSGIAAMMFHHFVMGKRSKYMKIYDPRRDLKIKALALKLRDFGEEFVGGALANTLIHRGWKKKR